MEGCLLWAILKRVIMWCINCIIIASERASKQEKEKWVKCAPNIRHRHSSCMSRCCRSILLRSWHVLRNSLKTLKKFFEHIIFIIWQMAREWRGKNVYLFCSTTGPSLSLRFFYVCLILMEPANMNYIHIYSQQAHTHNRQHVTIPKSFFSSQKREWVKLNLQPMAKINVYIRARKEGSWRINFFWMYMVVCMWTRDKWCIQYSKKKT